MALEDPDIDMFTSEEEEESESEEELGPTPIPSSSQQEQQLEQQQEQQQEQLEEQQQLEQQQQPAVILPGSQQHDADGTQQTQEQSQEAGSGEELRPSQALSPEDEVWMQKMDEVIAQCKADMAQLRENKKGELAEEEEDDREMTGRLEVDHDIEGSVALSGHLHQVEVEMEPSQDKDESHRKESLIATEMRNFLKLEQLFQQIQEQKQQFEKEMEERVGSLPEARQRVTMLMEAKQRIGRHMEDQKKKIAAMICSESQSS